MIIERYTMTFPIFPFLKITIPFNGRKPLISTLNTIFIKESGLINIIFISISIIYILIWYFKNKHQLNKILEFNKSDKYLVDPITFLKNTYDPYDRKEHYMFEEQLHLDFKHKLIKLIAIIILLIVIFNVLCFIYPNYIYLSL